jgi:pyruvate,water dikinase
VDKRDPGSSDIIRFLQEREKELACLYRIEEVANRPDATLEDVCRTAVEAIPPGWQYPEVCVVRLRVDGVEYKSEGFKKTRWVQCADIEDQDRHIGNIVVCYTEERPPADDGPFLKEEAKLLKTIAERIRNFITVKRANDFARRYEAGDGRPDKGATAGWRLLVNLVRETDKSLFMTVCQKMLRKS